MRYLLKNASIVDQNGESKTVHIVTENNRIVRVSNEEISIPVTEFDMTGYTVMPGFIHTHVIYLIALMDSMRKR